MTPPLQEIHRRSFARSTCLPEYDFGRIASYDEQSFTYPAKAPAMPGSEYPAAEVVLRCE